jgi:hypothetical protein
MSTPLMTTAEAVPLVSDEAGREFQLFRTGDQPLVFQGRLLAEAAGAHVNGRDRDRGHDLRIYQTVAGTYVVEIVYWSTWKGEAECRTVMTANREPSRVAVVLRLHDPLKAVQGYPPAERFKLKQDRLLARIRADYSTRVSDVLAKLPHAIERID